uniref:Peroxisomal ATPase PEX6 n=1 Tax=Triticum aestivum TaxID=4565 RepID=A0A3B6DJW6_WHEAT
MVERRSRRKPLVLASTQALLDSLPGERRGPAPPPPESVRLRAGVLRFPARPSGPGCGGEFGDLASFVALPTSALRRLAVVTGTTVLVKNTDNNVGRIVKAVVLDRPSLEESKREHPDSDPVASTSSSDRVMGFLPTRSFPANGFAPLDEDVAYVSPLLAFNLGVHVSCLKLLIQKGEEPFKFCSKVFEDGSAGSGTAIGGSDYQDMIDQALNEHFKFDRFLASGDVFCIHNDWNCGMISCLACNKENDRLHPPSMIYFKVTGMEPSNEPILRVNRDQTALVLGGSASAPIPPCSFFSANDDSVPLHGEVVEQLASIIAPALCPSNILPRIKFSTFLYGPSGCGKRTVVRHVANHLGMHVVECCCHDLMTSSESGASAALVAAFKEAQKYSPSIILLRHFDAIGNTSSNEGPQSEQSGIAANVESVIKQYTGQRWVVKDSLPARDVIGNSYLVEPECVSSVQVILVATADSAEGMQQSIRRCFRHEVNMKTINEDQRKNLISETLHGVSAVADESIDDKFVKDISVQTSGFMPRDILALVADAGVSFAHKVAVEKSSNDELEDAPTASSSTTQKEENHFCKEDILSSLERAKKRNRAALGTPKVPDVKWEDVGGLEEVKKVILDTIQLPLLYKHLFSSKLPKRSGVLLYGPPGTGKTLLAKAVATECSLNFLSVKGPELINMYVGESEKNVRDIFEKARSARPCVIFFDELDSLAPARGSSADSGGVMDRVVSQLLVEIDGLSDNSQDLFIIGATNRPDLLDSALLRPGRFDKLLYIGVNTEASYRERILKAQTRKYKLNENVSLLSIAQHCPPNFTGADIYALCADAWFHAAKRSVKTLEADPSRNNDAGAEEVIVETEDFMTVLGDISPSLSMEELQNYEQLRQKIEGPSR